MFHIRKCFILWDKKKTEQETRDLEYKRKQKGKRARNDGCERLVMGNMTDDLPPPPPPSPPFYCGTKEKMERKRGGSDYWHCVCVCMSNDTTLT